MSLEILARILDHDQSTPFSEAALLVQRCTIGANMGILAENGDELSRRQGQLRARFSVQVPLTLNVRVNHAHSFSIASLLVPRCTIGANLVIPALTGDELSRRQGRYGQSDGRTNGWLDGRTDGRTDGGDDNTPSTLEAER